MYHGQVPTFKQVEKTIEEVLDNLPTYYNANSMRANPEKKTQVTAFHLRNKEAKRSLKMVRKEQNGTKDHYPPEIPWCNIR